MKRFWLLVCFTIFLAGCAPNAPPENDTPPPVQGQSAAVSAPEPDADNAASPLDLRYGRSFLSPVEQQIYDDFYRLLSNMEIGGEVAMPGGVTEAQITRILGYFVGDNPEFFWAEPQYLVGRAQGNVSALTFGFLHGFSAEEVQRRNQAVREQRDLLLAGLPQDPAAAAIELHDRLLRHITYDTSADSTGIGNLYGGLVQGFGVCDAYSKSYQYLLQELGIPCIYLQGTTTRGETHSWNAVMLNGAWHYTDVTWDDQEHISHAYLNISSEEMQREHYWDIDQYPLIPETAAGADYYRLGGYTVQAGGADQVLAGLSDAFARQFEARAAAGEPVYLEVKVLGGPDDYKKVKDLFLQNIFDVMNGMEARLREADAPVRLAKRDAISCNYNDTLQILILLPDAE